MKIRVWGTRIECEDLVNEIVAIFKIDGYTIRSVSPYYPNRPPFIEGRVYIEID